MFSLKCLIALIFCSFSAQFSFSTEVDLGNFAPSSIHIGRTIDFDYNSYGDGLIEQLKADLAIVSDSFLDKLIDFDWDIILDERILGIGYASPSLTSSDGNPAIILNPQIYTSRENNTLLHELAHLAHYSIRKKNKMKLKEEPWVEEGIAVLVEYRLTGTLHPSFRDFYFNSQIPDFKDIPIINTSHLGYISLYFYYIYNSCGGDELFHKLIMGKSGLIGKRLVNSALKSINKNRKHEDGSAAIDNSRRSGCDGFSNSIHSFSQVLYTSLFVSAFSNESALLLGRH